MTIGAVVDKMSGRNYLRICKRGEYDAETVYTDENGWNPVPDDLMDIELAEIDVENCCLILYYDED